ncbi:MAG: hypothetical protein K1X53_13110 [Candidatus Sumerlaeaceae bacterium]|nr:hypothetical protein [Candidatus Sumerlaeaceae bacterium]
MPSINQSFKELICKIVFYGPGFGGKTTNLQLVHGAVPDKHRGQLVSLATEQDQTLFFDYLPLDMGEVKGYKTKFQLYTVPGQVYYNATRKLVLRGVDGIVFVADSQESRLKDNIESFNNLMDNLREYGLDFDTTPLVMQYNKRDLPTALPLEELNKFLNPASRFPVFEAVATEGIGIKETLREISSRILQKLNEQSNIMSDEELVADRLGLKGAGVSENLEDSSKKGFKAVSQTGPELEMSQQSRVSWNGLGIGSGALTLSTLKDPSGNVEYTLSSTHRAFIVKRSFVRTLRYIGEDRRKVGAEVRSYHVLRDVTAGKTSAPISAYVEKSATPRLYVVYPGIAGEIKIGPEGEDFPL